MSKLYIHKHIQIVNNAVYLNGEELFRVDKSEAFTVFAKALYQHFDINYSKFYKMDTLSKLGFLAADLLLKDVDRSMLSANETALIFANKSSSLHTDTIYQETIQDIPSPAIFVYTLANIVLGEIAIKHDIKGESLFFIQDSFDTKFFAEYIPILFATSPTKLCITGWVEINAAEAYEADLYLVSEEESATLFTTETLHKLHTSWKN